MTASAARTRFTPSALSSVRAAAAVSARSTLYGAALIPLSVASLVDVAVRRPSRATTRWNHLRSRLLGQNTTAHVTPPPTPRLAAHALASLLLGVLALIPIGIELLFVLRGVLYGLVDRGPYNDSWGGPTRAGAWATHFAVAVPLLVAALSILAGIANLHSRLTRRLDGEQLAWWVLPVAVAASAAGAVFVVGWWHQI